MSWLFSQALVAEYSAENCSDGAPSAPSSSTPTPQAYLSPDKTTDFSRPSRFGMTFGPLMEYLGGELLTWFLADFPVRTFPPQEKAAGSTESAADSGGKWHESLAKYDPATSSWKTHQYSLLGDLEPYSGTWPRWGTMRNGECWERPTWERRTEGNGSGFWGTPNARDHFPAHKPEYIAAKKAQGHGMKNLNDQVAMVNLGMWPTPTVFGNYNRKGASANSGDGLATAVRMLPTPTVNDAKNSTLPPSQVDHDNLPGYLLRNGVQTGGQLNPTWVEWLMGWPLGWTDLNASATDKYPPVPPKLSGDCVNERLFDPAARRS